MKAAGGSHVKLLGKAHQLQGFGADLEILRRFFALAVDNGFVFKTPAKQTNRLKISLSHLGTPKNHFFDGWKWGFPNISHVKIWFIIQFRGTRIIYFQIFSSGWIRQENGEKNSDRTTHHLSTEPALLRAPYCWGTYSGRFARLNSEVFPMVFFEIEGAWFFMWYPTGCSLIHPMVFCPKKTALLLFFGTCCNWKSCFGRWFPNSSIFSGTCLCVKSSFQIR